MWIACQLHIIKAQLTVGYYFGELSVNRRESQTRGDDASLNYALYFNFE